MGSEEDTERNGRRGACGRQGRGIQLRDLLLVLIGLASILLFATVYELGEKVAYQTAEQLVQENLQSMQQLSTQGFLVVQKLSKEGLHTLVEEVDHMYHYLTDTNDDDGHIQMLSGNIVTKEQAAAALAGEELLSPRSGKAVDEQFATVVQQEGGEEDQAGDGDEGAGGEEEGNDAKIELEEEVVEKLSSEAVEGEEGEDRALVDEADNEAEEDLEEDEAGMELERAKEVAIDEERQQQEARMDAQAQVEMGLEGLILPLSIHARVRKGYNSSDESGGTQLGRSAMFAERQMLARMAMARQHPRCGGMPKSFGPKFTDQKEPQTRTKVYPSKEGYVMPLNLQNKQVKVLTEHGKRGARKATNKRSLKQGERDLTQCLNNLGKCSSQAMRAALMLRGMQEALSTKNKMFPKRYRNCAVVGNSGGMKHHQYGTYIDQHDFVVRINILPMEKHIEHLGTKVDARVLSYKMSKDVCCIKKDYAADNNDLEYFIWFPADQKNVASRMKKKLKTNPVRIVNKPFIKSSVLAFKAFRGELLRLGYGPFEDWEYMTSGMHAVLGLLRSCDNIDIYGFTTDMNNAGPYWFTGRRVAPRSGQTQHAWDHERMVLRLLHAAGAINICTS